jgi:hypothetical protein
MLFSCEYTPPVSQTARNTARDKGENRHLVQSERHFIFDTVVKVEAGAFKTSLRPFPERNVLDLVKFLPVENNPFP